MALAISKQDLARITESHEEIVLGIIMRDETVRLCVSDQHRYPGHWEWIERDAFDRDAIYRGFSIMVHNGLVTRIYRNSRVNEEKKGFVIEDALVEELQQLLPLADDHTRDTRSDQT